MSPIGRAQHPRREDAEFLYSFSPQLSSGIPNRRTPIIMNPQTSGYQEIEHTADIELHVWGPDLVTLLKQAAKGMYALSGTQLTEEPRLSRAFEISFWDRETLLVDFLSELLFYGEDEKVGFDEYQLEIDENKLNARAEGANIESQKREIKAVTYHNLEILETERGLATSIVFDI